MKNLNRNFIFILSAFWSIVGASYIFLITFVPIPKENQRFADTIIGFLLGTVVATIITYFLGSSKGSSDKSEMMNKVKEEV